MVPRNIKQCRMLTDKFRLQIFKLNHVLFSLLECFAFLPRAHFLFLALKQYRHTVGGEQPWSLPLSLPN